MRILILGNDYCTQSLFKFFEKNKDNIVFTTKKDCNFIDLITCDDILDFIEANQINFVLITQEDYINQGIADLISAKNITVFSPDMEAIAISASKAAAKKFMYKNLIPTPKFQIFDKLPSALDCVKHLENPIAIKPDSHSTKECTQFCETTSQAQKVINDLFKNGNDKILIEDYIEGKNIEVFILSDGFKFQILGISAKYQNNIAYFEPEFVKPETVEKIIQDIISPTIEALIEQGDEYIGILGFDIILTRDDNFYLVGYNSFFDDIDIDFYLRGFKIDWLNVFESTIIGDVFSKYEISSNNDYMMTFKDNGKINFVSAKTKRNLKLYLEELYSTKEYKEAFRLWGF